MGASNRKRLPFYPERKDVKVGDQVYSLLSNYQNDGCNCSVSRGTLYKVIDFDPHRAITLKIDCCETGHYWYPENFEVVVEPAVVQMVPVMRQNAFTLFSQLSNLIFIPKIVGYSEAEKMLRELLKEIKKRG